MIKKTLTFVGLLVFALGANAASINIINGVVDDSVGAFTQFAPVGTTLESTLDWDGANLVGAISELSTFQCFASDASGLPTTSGSCNSLSGVSAVLATGETTYDGTPAAAGATFDQAGSTFNGVNGILNTLAYSEIFNINISIEYSFLEDGTGTFFADGGSFGYAGGTFEVAPVPIPAAAWLFGSALLGLGAIRRKRS